MQLLRSWRTSLLLVILLSRGEDQQSQQHADTGQSEAILEAEALTHPDDDQGGQQGPQVDTDVEDGEAGVATRVVGSIKLTHQAGDVGLEVTVSHDDGCHAHIEPCLAAAQDQELTDGHHHGAQDHCDAVAQDAVGQASSQHRCHVDQRGVGSVDGERLVVALEECLGEVEHQQSPHAEVTEALPHLG